MSTTDPLKRTGRNTLLDVLHPMVGRVTVLFGHRHRWELTDTGKGLRWRLGRAMDLPQTREEIVAVTAGLLCRDEPACKGTPDAPCAEHLALVDTYPVDPALLLAGVGL